MLLAIFRIPWLLFPVTGVIGFGFGVTYNADHKICPGLIQQQQADGDLRRQQQVLSLAEQQRQSLIRVCEGIQNTNAAMLTPQCKQVLFAPGGRP